MKRVPKSLHETENYRCLGPGVHAGKIAAYFHISAEFMKLGKVELEESSFSQMGLYRYSVGVFCLGHAFELLYKALLLVDENESVEKYRHDFGRMYKAMSCLRRSDLECIIVAEGWSSVGDFHEFMLETIDSVNRKYFDTSSGLDVWSHDSAGTVSHKLWPGLVQLWERIRDYAASQIWKDPDLPIC